MNQEDKNWEDFRQAAFDIWKEKEQAKWDNCPTKHRWSYSEPTYCLDCHIPKSKNIVKNN